MPSSVRVCLASKTSNVLVSVRHSPALGFPGSALNKSYALPISDSLNVIGGSPLSSLTNQQPKPLLSLSAAGLDAYAKVRDLVRSWFIS